MNKMPGIDELKQRIGLRWTLSEKDCHGKDIVTELVGGTIADFTEQGFTSTITVKAEIPGSYKVKAEITGQGDIGKSISVGIVNRGPLSSSALPGDELSYGINAAFVTRKVWGPEKVVEHLGEMQKVDKLLLKKKLNIPDDTYCTKDFTWKELLIGQTVIPPREVLENLAKVAEVIQHYRDTVFNNSPIKITQGWISPGNNSNLSDPKPSSAKYNISSELEHAKGNAINFTVRGMKESKVWKLLDPIHQGGMEMRKTKIESIHIDLRGYYARAHLTPDGNSVFDRLMPAGCKALTGKSEEEIKKLSKGGIPDGCTCARVEGDPSKHQPASYLPIESCKCFAEDAPQPVGSEVLASAAWNLAVGENPYAIYTGSVRAVVYGTQNFIQEVWGYGNGGCKSYAFYGGFINIKEVNSSILEKKLGEAGFSETWIIKIPVNIELRGNFNLLGTSIYEHCNQKITVIHMGPKDTQAVSIESIKVSGYPESIGPAYTEVTANTAGDGEAHGSHVTSKYTFHGVSVSPIDWVSALMCYVIPSITINYRYGTGGGSFRLMLSVYGPESFKKNPEWQKLNFLESSPPLTYEQEEESAQSLATKILYNPNIHLDEEHSESPPDNASARRNIEDTIAGTDVSRTPPNAKGGVGGTTKLDYGMLKAILKLAEKYKLNISELAGGVHSNRSAHYDGLAFDVNYVNGKHADSANEALKQFEQDCKELGAAMVLWYANHPAHKDHAHVSFPPYEKTKEFWSKGIKPIYDGSMYDD